MVRGMILSMALLTGAARASAPQATFSAFEVATVKPVDVGPRAGRTFRMEGDHRWLANNFTLKSLVALAYDLNPRTISGGPAWMDEIHFNIEAVTPGDRRPTRKEQMTMLRALLTERFALKFHRVDKEFSIYELSVAKGGPKLSPAAHPDADPYLVGVVEPGKIKVPATNVSMEDFASMLQRATLDRPVVDKTGLRGTYDFTLTWAMDETQYGGELGRAPEDTNEPPLFRAVQEQLGLKLTPTHGMVSSMVVDGAEKPSAG